MKKKYLSKKWVDLVLAKYHPQKNEQWVQEQYARCFDNTDFTDPEDEKTIVSILEHDFGIDIVKRPISKTIAAEISSVTSALKNHLY